MTYRPATRADLVPGAVFVVRKEDNLPRAQLEMPAGTLVALHGDDGSEDPKFCRLDGLEGKWFLHLSNLERIHPPAADTVAIPREVAREFVRTHGADGYAADLNGLIEACRALRAALLSAAPDLLDPPPPTPDEVAAARLVIERAGMRVVS